MDGDRRRAVRTGCGQMFWRTGIEHGELLTTALALDKLGVEYRPDHIETNGSWGPMGAGRGLILVGQGDQTCRIANFRLK